MKIAFTGGSTGGHVFPIRSLIQYIKSNTEINAKFETMYRFGEKNSMEERTCTDLQQYYDNLTFETVIAGKVRREHDFRALLLNIIDLFRFIWGVIIMIVRLPHYRIDVVFCKGGFVSLPLTIAAWVRRKKIYVHESDTRAGLATRICGYFATHNFSAFPDTLPHSQVVGQIMSNDLIGSGPHQYGDPLKTNLLITGGSLGAKAIYESIIQLNKTTTILQGFNIIIILGSLNQDMKPQFEGRTYVIDRADQTTMGSLYQRADICICRGGTTTLAELEIFSIRKLIIPLPITHDQYHNAEYYVHHHHDHLITQNNTIIETLTNTLQKYQGYHKTAATHQYQINYAAQNIISIIMSK